MERIAIEFGRWVTRQREALKLSQDRLAEQVGMDQAAMSRLEAGQRRVSLEEAIRIADALNIANGELAEFLSGLRGSLSNKGSLWIGQSDDT